MEDYGMHFSPDSWSSGSGPEGSLSLEELSTWAETALQKEMGSKTFATSETVSSSVSEQKQDFAVPRSQDGNITATLHHPSTAPEKPKGKARVVFTERQLNILVHHFNLKRYYEPGEMKQLAEMTGLTYRQVKTWFQNRRRKFRGRSHPQHVNQGFPLHFQGNGQPPLREQYSQHMEINIIRDISNDQNHSPHPVDNFAAGPQLTFPNSPTGNNQYEFNPVASTIVQRNNSGPHNTYGACGDPCQQPMLLQML